MGEVSFLTNYAQVLLCIARDPDTRLRHIAECIGITERATHRIVSDLIEAGYLTRNRLGRRSYYEIHTEVPLQDPFTGSWSVRDLMKAFLRRETAPPSTPAPASSI